MRRSLRVLLILGMLASSGAAFADSISDVYFISLNVTGTDEGIVKKVSEGRERLYTTPAFNSLKPNTAVLIMDANNQISDVVYTSPMVVGLETLNFCSSTPSALCKPPKGSTVAAIIPETSGEMEIGNYFNPKGGHLVAGDITITSVPEPGTLVLFATGLVSIAGAMGRRFRM